MFAVITKGRETQVKEFNITVESYADNTELEEAIAAAQALADDETKVAGDKPGQYDSAKHQALIDEIAAAQIICNNPDATQAEVNNAIDALEQKMTAYEGSKKPNYGDVFGTGSDPEDKDTMAVLHDIVGLKKLKNDEIIRADVNGDEEINVQDGVLIARFVSGKIDKFPVEN